MAREDNVQWSYTQKVNEFLNSQERHPIHEETGKLSDSVKEWRGRPVIHRDSRINKGAYLCADETQAIQEACVVDDEKQPALKACYQELMTRAVQRQAQTGMPLKHFVLDMALDLTQEVMPYNLPFVLEAASKYEPGEKIELASYVEKHAGVCRHQALLAAYMIEKMIDEGILSGKVSVDRNILPEKGGHAWVRYTASSGMVYILDPAQNFRGTLEESTKNAYWDYRRPEDREKSATVFFDKLKNPVNNQQAKISNPV